MSSCLISKEVIGIPVSNTPGCPKGFYCSESLKRNLVSEICPGNEKCTIDRLKGKACDAQGSLEPILCTAGSVCETGLSKEKCPKGHYCPAGTFNAIKCNPLSICPEGSSGPIDYMGIVICLAIDVLLAIIVLHRKGILQKFPLYEPRPVKNHNDENLDSSDMVKMGARASKMARRIEDKLMTKLALKSPKLTEKDSSNFDGDTLVMISNLDISGKVKSSDLEEYLESLDNPNEDSDMVLNRIKEKYGYVKMDMNDNTCDDNVTIKNLMELYHKCLGSDNVESNLEFSGITVPEKYGSSAHYTGKLASNKLTGIIGARNACENKLIEILGGRKKKNSGIVKFNGMHIDPNKLRNLFGYAHSEPSFNVGLSTRDNIWYSAHIRKPRNISNYDTEKCVDYIMDLLQLNNVSDVVINDVHGNDLDESCKKRVAIGMELVSLPRILYIEDVVGKLNHISAIDLMKKLKRLTGAGFTIAGTINHASNMAFEACDNAVVICSSGETIYSADQSNVQVYFEKLGFKFPFHANLTTEIIEIGSGNGVTHMHEALLLSQLVTCWENHDMLGEPCVAQHVNDNDINDVDNEAFEYKTAKNDFISKVGAIFNNKRIPFSHRNVKVVDVNSSIGGEYEKEYNPKNSNGNNKLKEKRDLKAEHLLTKNKMGASWYEKVRLYSGRAIQQTFSTPSNAFLELFVPSILGLTIGLLISSNKHELLSGTYIDPLSSLSPANSYWTLYLLSIITSILVAIYSSIYGSNEFANEMKTITYEINTGQHSFTAYFLTKTLILIFRVALVTLHYISFFSFLGRQPVSLAENYLIIVLQTISVISTSSAVGVLKGNSVSSLRYAFLINIVFAIFSGIKPISNNSTNSQGIPLMGYANVNSWSIEALFSLYARKYSHVYKFSPIYIYGFNENNLMIDISVMAIIAIVMRLFTFVLVGRLIRN